MLSALLLPCCDNTFVPAVVQVQEGQLRGEDDKHVKRFLGVPYAEPPVNARRFAAPLPVVPWAGVRDALDYGDACAQLNMDRDKFEEDSSEDCLYLNVWAPSKPGVYPVMVWIPGGAYVLGSAAQTEFNGYHLSKQRDVVVVGVNYRLAALGFMSHEALGLAEPGNTGNYGLLDQREALRWVQKNIAAFGGDPANVTLFGESAGGGSTCMHLVAPGSEGLFNKAIMESAPCTAFEHQDLPAAHAQARLVSDAVGCQGTPEAVVACLRAVDVQTLLFAIPPNEHFVYGGGLGWYPVVDGVVVPQQPVDAFRTGVTAARPLIVGANSDEATVLIKKDTINTTEDLRAFFQEFYFQSPEIDAIMAFYATESSPAKRAERALTDMFICDARRVAGLHAAAGGAAFHYHFTAGFYDAVLGAGAFHTAEIPFVFGTTLGLPLPPSGIPLKNAVQGYWTQFARTGDPNHNDLRTWPRYESASDQSIRLDLVLDDLTGVRKQACDFWDAVRM